MSVADEYAAKLGATGQIGSFRAGQAVSNVSQFAKPIAPTKPDNSQSFLQKAGAVAKQGLDITAGIMSLGGTFVAHSLQDSVRNARGTASTLNDLATYPIRSYQNEQNSKVLRGKLVTTTQDYKAGKISRENYEKSLKDINTALDDINKSANQIATSRGVRERDFQIANTTFDVVSLGDLKLAAVGGREVAEAGGKQAVKLLIDDGATGLEKQILKAPFIRDLVERNLATAGKVAQSESTSQYIFREGRHLAASYLIKRPLFYQSNLGQATKVYDDIIHGNYSQAARDASWIGIQMLQGGIIGAAAKIFGIGKTVASKLAYGEGSLIDELSGRIGTGSRTQVAELLATIKSRNPQLGKEYEDALKVMQESSGRIYGKDVASSAQNILSTFMGRDFSTISAREVLDTQLRWKQADDLARQELTNLVKKGVMSEQEAARYTPVRWDSGLRDAAVNIIKQAGIEPERQWQAIQNWAESGPISVANNRNLMDRLHYEIFKNAGGSGDIQRAIQNIDAASTVAPGLTKGIKAKLARLGYVLAEPASGRAVENLNPDNLPKLISAASKNHVDMFNPDAAAQPVVHAFAEALKKIGLSPEATTRLANQKLSESVVGRLGNLELSHNFSTLNKEGNQVNAGQAILSRLQSYVENMKGNTIGRILTGGTNDKSAVTDIRQLTRKEVVQALSGDGVHITSADAKAIQQAVKKGYTDIPLELRGGGDKIVDWLYRINPTQKFYSRMQSAFRYTYNPFFRIQEGTETFIGSGAFGGNRATHLLQGKSRAELEQAVKVLDDSRIFSSSLYGEAAQDVLLGRLSANISKGQKRDLAGLALDIAQKKGTTLEHLVNENPDDIADALRVIVQYPQKGVLASPLARTLNLVFFPMRYNLKVTKLAAEVLGKQPPVIQSAVLHSLFNFDGWLKSDEGITWQQQHADAIQVFNWLTPVNSIEYTLSLLNGVHSAGDLGSLGGLPLGVITQIMDSLGIINLNTPYVNPKTGDVIPKHIPQTARADAATALTEVLGSMFTYPGRTLGLPGKQASINDFVKKFIATNGTDFITQDEMDRLTPLQQDWVRVLKGDTSQEAVDKLYNNPTPGNFPWYTLPPNAVPYKVQPQVPKATPLAKRSLPAKTKGKKAKPVAQPISR